MAESVNLARRRFLVGSAGIGGGLLLGFHLPGGIALAAQTSAAGSAAQAVEVNAWILIHPDNSVVIRVARSEMGQGIFTALPMLVAEELDCDWESVRAEYASAQDNLRRGNVYVSMATGGSRSVRGSQEFLRTAGAAARHMLVEAAAHRWGVPPGECRTARGVVTHPASGRSLRYGEVADAAAQLQAPETVLLKDPDEWTLIGKPVRRLDVPDKVAGRPVYAVDVELPGMLHAAIRACPVFGGRLKNHAPEKIEGHAGVERVVSLDDAVAVVADTWWHAEQALEALPVEWDTGDNGNLDDAGIRGSLEDALTAADAVTGTSVGDVEAALAGGGQRVEATLYAPYLAHATMEPMTCTARVSDDGVELWVPTQNATASLETAARAAGVDRHRVIVHNTQLGGGFGRRGMQDYVEQAVRIAAAVKQRPVKLIWSREQDMQHDFYRPASTARLSAALDAGGNLKGLRVRVAGPSILASVRPGSVRDGRDPIALDGFDDQPYDIPAYLTEYAMRTFPVPVGFWRSVNQSQNAYFREHFLDQVARKAGQDPYAFRMRLLGKSARQRAVLKAAAEKAGWGQPLPKGHFHGIALATSFGTHCAEVAEIRLEDNGRFRLERIVCAIDPGYVVNPDAVEAQVESAIVYGLTAALFGEVTLEKGRVKQGNFDDYPMLLLRHMPRVETHIVASGDFWGGMGEPPLPPVAPALCNALYAATGRPIQALPLAQAGFRPA